MELRFVCLIEGTDNAYLHTTKTFKSSSGYLILLFTDMEWLSHYETLVLFKKFVKT